MIARLSSAASLGAAVWLLSGTAFAQEASYDPLGGTKHRYKESPQNFAAELRLAPYLPDVDSDPALHGNTPYKQVFGSSPRLLVSGEFDWQAFRIPHVGTIGPGIGVGYATMSDPAQFSQPHNGQTTSGESTTLEIYPFYGVAVLRADVLWREIGIPLVPYVKAGIGYALWRASNTLGTSSFDGKSGLGHSLGVEFALGVGLNLNIFDEYAAKNFDEAMGVNGTYLFAEWTHADLAGLGLQSDPLRVGSTNATFGLAFEF
ncbi:MAG TPA: MXAN_2562 family outer membrane beta-barrel protein [Polyangiaceae bacterium]|nr:MXAN_2562 family outer membrane beta-barrel protein [Polyangiaceae bacterium]